MQSTGVEELFAEFAELSSLQIAKVCRIRSFFGHAEFAQSISLLSLQIFDSFANLPNFQCLPSYRVYPVSSFPVLSSVPQCAEQVSNVCPSVNIVFQICRVSTICRVYQLSSPNAELSSFFRIFIVYNVCRVSPVFPVRSFSFKPRLGEDRCA